MKGRDMKTKLMLLATALSAGCTSVDVTRVDPANPRTRVGLPYPLPMTQYRLQLVRQVVGCGSDIKLSASTKVEEARNAPDPLQQFVIDPASLGSLTKTSEIKAEYHPNGLVKAINATAEDKTAEIIGTIGGIGVKIASLAAGFGAEAGQEACTDEVVQALEKVAAQKPKLALATQKVEEKTAELKRLKEKAATLGTLIDEGSKSQLSTAYDQLTAAIEAQKAEARALAKLMEPLSHVQVVQWPPDGDTGRGVFPFDRALLKRWKRPGGDEDPAAAEAIEQELRKLDIYAQLIPLTGTGRRLETERPLRPFQNAAGGDPSPNPGAAFKTAADTVVPSLGIPFRQPDLGWLRLCSSAHCDSGGDPLADQRGNVSQMGYIYYLPCESRAFSSTSCSFELTEDGWLKSMGTAEKKAVLAEGLGAVEDLLGKAGAIQSTLQGADTAAYKRKTDELKAEAEYRAAQKAMIESPTAPLAARTELARAEKEALEAEAELAEVQRLLGRGL